MVSTEDFKSLSLSSNLSMSFFILFKFSLVPSLLVAGHCQLDVRTQVSVVHVRVVQAADEERPPELYLLEGHVDYWHS